jgi:hypothetical protein
MSFCVYLQVVVGAADLLDRDLHLGGVLDHFVVRQRQVRRRLGAGICQEQLAQHPHSWHQLENYLLILHMRVKSARPTKAYQLAVLVQSHLLIQYWLKDETDDIVALFDFVALLIPSTSS